MKTLVIKLMAWLALLAIVPLGLTACSGSTPVPEPTEIAVAPSPTSIPPTNTPVPPTDTPIPPTDTPVPPTDTPPPPTETPTQEVELASLSSENCVGCHTDEATLQALAEDTSVKSEATSGEG